jgi:hypothetical protein
MGKLSQVFGYNSLVADAFPEHTLLQGKWVFVGSLILVLLWLIVMPRRLAGETAQRSPWWRNVRMWAILICLFQIWIYWRFA